MPVARFQMPDGRIGRFEVPEGTTPEAAEAMINEHIAKPQAELKQGTPSFIEKATSNVSPIDDPSKMAGVGTQAIASLPADVKERASYFAKQRFPNDPNAVSRYGVQDGRLFYMGDDGNIYFEEPAPSASVSGMAKYAASGVGPMLPVAGGIAGGVVSSPMGGMPGAATGAAAGDEVRQALAMALAGQEEFKPGQTAKEAGMGAFGQGVGAGLVKMGNRAAARDIAKAMTPEAKARQDYMDEIAREFNITLTPAERTGLPSLVSRQNTLSSLPESADILKEKVYTPRNEQEVPAAVDKMLGKFSSVSSPEVGAQNLQTGAKAAIDTAKTERRTVSKPLYNDIFPKRIPPSKLQNIASGNVIIMNAIQAAPHDEVTQFYIQKYMKETGKEISGNSVGFLDAVKQSLDGKAKAAQAAGNDKAAGAYSQSAEQLRTAIDKIVPGYEKARAAYAGESPAVEALTKGEVGLAAGKKPTQLETVPSTIFESGPDSVAKNRAAYVKAGKEQEWNDGLRAHLQQQFDKASKEYVNGNANPGARFRSLVFGTGQQKLALQRAMTPEQWAGFNRLMDVLEASGRVPAGGSRTTFAARDIEQMKKESGSIPGKVLRAMNPRNLVDTSRLADWLDEIKFGKHAANLAEIIASPDAMNQLKALRALPPNSVKARVIAAQVLSQYGFSEVSEPGDAPSGKIPNPPKRR